MEDFILSQIQAITGSTRAVAEQVFNIVLSDNAMMILSLAERAIQYETTDQKDTILYDTIDDSLWARYERFGTPVGFRHREFEINDEDLTAYYDVCIAEITVVIDGIPERRFALIGDLLNCQYEFTCHHIVAGMAYDDPTPGLAGLSSRWEHGDGAVLARHGAVEWFDEDYQYHVTERGNVTGTNVLRYRKYVE